MGIVDAHLTRRPPSYPGLLRAGGRREPLRAAVAVRDRSRHRRSHRRQLVWCGRLRRPLVGAHRGRLRSAGASAPNRDDTSGSSAADGFLSDAEAASWGTVDVLSVGLWVFTLARVTSGTIDVGATIAMIAYVAFYTAGFEEVPGVLQRLTRLRDIKRRLDGSGSATPPERLP